MYGMMKMFSSMKEFYNDINRTMMTGAIDVIVVEQPDGTYTCSPFHVRFGTLGVLRSREKVIDIEINGVPQDIHMKLGESGEAFFVEELDSQNEVPQHLSTSPIPEKSENSVDLEDDETKFENVANDYLQHEYSRELELDLDDRQIPKYKNDRHNDEATDGTNESKIYQTICNLDNIEPNLNTEKYIMMKEEEVASEGKIAKKKKKKLRKKTTRLNNTEKIPDTILNTDKSSTSDSSASEIQNLEHRDNNGKVIPVSKDNKILPDFNFFSDTELTSNNASDSRQASPVYIESVLSDSEIEVNKSKVDIDNTKNWEWGGFPSVPNTNATTSKDEQKSILSSWFWFMKQKHNVQNPLDDGVYLSDVIKEIEAGKTDVYCTQLKKGNDVDLENNPLITKNNENVEEVSLDSHVELSEIYCDDIALSLCGWDPKPTEDKFLEKIVEYSDLCDNPILFEDSNLVVKIKEKYYSWKIAASIITCIMVFGKPLLQSSVDKLLGSNTPPNSSEVDNKEESDIEELDETIVENTSSTPKESEEICTPLQRELGYPNVNTSPTDKYKKTLRLTSKQLKSLKLRDGMNEVEFSVTTAYQGTTRCQCHLYKWKWDDKIVISDIDGTITKSDVLGHLLPIVGKDWSQSGVAQLFNKIKNNGYKLLYLSSRAIGQARITRDYLRSIEQGDLNMPYGPILLNPASLLAAFHREVIEKKPEKFKISCLSDIKALFPAGSNPFYAGYGNRINDAWAYRAVGIPTARIFTINPKGELKHEVTQTFQSSYSNMSIIVDQMFPAVVQEAVEYSPFVYWREPIPSIDDLKETT